MNATLHLPTDAAAQRRCACCDILIYRSRDEAVAIDRTYWAARREHMTDMSVRSHASGARLVPHVNGAVGDLCAACARETAGHKGLVTGRQIALYEKYFGGPFPAQEMSRKGGLVDKQEYGMRQKMDDEELVAAHRRYVMENLTLKELAETSPMSADPLRKHFNRLGLPTRTRGSNAWASDDLARVCLVHDLQPDEVPGPTGGEEQEVGPEVKEYQPGSVRARTPKPKAKSRPQPTAVVPVQETAVPVATNGNGHSHGAIGDLAVVNEQLAALQALLSQAEAKSVIISGRIRLELTAEVEL